LKDLRRISIGLASSAELQGMALMEEKMLKPYKKTLLQAAEFYRDHLEKVQRTKASAKVARTVRKMVHWRDPAGWTDQN